VEETLGVTSSKQKSVIHSPCTLPAGHSRQNSAFHRVATSGRLSARSAWNAAPSANLAWRKSGVSATAASRARTPRATLFTPTFHTGSWRTLAIATHAGRRFQTRHHFDPHQRTRRKMAGSHPMVACR
jgi:hypothetical protein